MMFTAGTIRFSTVAEARLHRDSATVWSAEASEMELVYFPLFLDVAGRSFTRSLKEFDADGDLLLVKYERLASDRTLQTIIIFND